MHWPTKLAPKILHGKTCVVGQLLRSSNEIVLIVGAFDLVIGLTGVLDDLGRKERDMSRRQLQVLLTKAREIRARHF